MKIVPVIGIILLLLATAYMLAGCSTTQVAAFNAKVVKVEAASQADLQAAGDRATAAAAATPDTGLQGALKSRATFWYAAKSLVAAQENQANVCGLLIESYITVQPSAGALKFAGPADALEAGAEKVGSLSGVPTAVKLACEPLPIPALPVLPAVPKFDSGDAPCADYS